MKVNLKIKEDESITTVQHDIEEMNIIQITKAIKKIKEIFDIAQKDQNLQALLVDVFDESQKADEDKAAESEFGQRIIANAIGALDVLLMEIPDKALELLSILSGIDYETFVQQKAMDVFDIYDAIIQVNDIDQLIKRAKKSLALTKAQTKFMTMLKPKQTVEPVQA
ncbi:hypothetical protein GCM10011409_19100 [Lentibacillus populi]|uniref:Uncharacterized protein n=1 Tax=Lentibacillus populi TaxID=1827502 RepID=A0A9W5TXK8_9BACI|nr:hypothetical protein [Lentibacillus populi]GGB41739.1 hypothetical protein GCM10011409_19100 [Lentibacillus populi]